MTSTRARFDAEPVVQGLKGFQRDTVEHVTNQFFGTEPSRRFLVADETGLGKSMVARGVIARTIEKLQDDDRVDRIDIVYVCSNSEIAKQNLSRLNVLPAADNYNPVESASRLTLLAKHARHFARDAVGASKPVNLVSFTPGTSFDMGWQTGTAEERALLFMLLEPHLRMTDGHQRRTALNLLRGNVGSVERFEERLGLLTYELDGSPDQAIARKFLKLVRSRGLISQFRELMADLGRTRDVPNQMRPAANKLIGQLRSELAHASVETLEPDLVILDEFQRFRNLLEKGTDAGELAHNLFDYGVAKVLLLSATPYKPFSYAEENKDDHYRDFMQTLEFLAGGGASIDTAKVRATFAKFRETATSGLSTSELTAELREQLIRVMSRNERSDFGSTNRLIETRANTDVEPADLLGFAGLRRLAARLRSPMTIEYWKSAPYFINFCDTYRIGRDLKEALADPVLREELRPELDSTQRVQRAAVTRREQIDYGNARMRALAHATVDAGWWQLLWVPPSLPYLTPGGPYGKPFAATMTKRIVFSSWAATPTAVAALLSNSAEHSIYSTAKVDPTRRVAQRLRYRVDAAGQASTMTTLALFWPTPGLADLADPRVLARESGAALDETAARATVAARLEDLPAGTTQHGSSGDAWYWIATLCRPDSLPNGVTNPGKHMGSHTVENSDEHDSSLIAVHVTRALGTSASDAALPPRPTDLADTVASLALHSPANIAWRALGRIIEDQSAVTPVGHWHAAVALAEGLRSLFNRPESTLLLGTFAKGNEPYWRTVLRYCAWGNLQAVLDEHLHHFYNDKGSPALTDDSLLSIATAIAATMGLRVAQYSALDPLDPEGGPIHFGCRFALRYGGKRESDEDARMPEVREAFNSPFWPFVLASTSVGQEGIDFHRWSHSVVHWNTPANPVDFEQREGRVDRYAGHVIRRNLAVRHSEAILRSGDHDPWKAAFRLGLDEQARFGEFAPWWVYPGPAKIERIVMPYPLSVDNARLEQLKKDVQLYRLTFGQPRQEDMLELLKRRYEGESEAHRRGLLLDLRPPRSGC